jgi:hypothetical protein
VTHPTPDRPGPQGLQPVAAASIRAEIDEMAGVTRTNPPMCWFGRGGCNGLQLFRGVVAVT